MPWRALRAARRYPYHRCSVASCRRLHLRQRHIDLAQNIAHADASLAGGGLRPLVLGAVGPVVVQAVTRTAVGLPYHRCRVRPVPGQVLDR